MADTNTLLQTALDYHQQGFLNEAEGFYQAVLIQNPAHADALHLLGILTASKGEPGRGEGLIMKAIEQNPSGIYFDSLGNVQGALGKAQDAIHSYHQALSLNPLLEQTHYNLGFALQNVGRTADALASYNQALALKPAFMEALLNRGSTYHDMQRYEEAEQDYQAVLVINPNLPQAHNNLGLIYHKGRRFDEAIVCFQRALAVAPDYADPLNNWGNTLMWQGHYDEAEALFNRVIQLSPTMAEVYNNLGILCNENGRFTEGDAFFNRALSYDPNYHIARWNRSHRALMCDDYENGWADFEARWQLSTYEPKRSKQPEWNGESLPNGTILLYGEGGYGDHLHFVRYLSDVKARVGRVIVEVRPGLRTLLQQMTGWDDIIERGEFVPDHDVSLPMMSLPLALRKWQPTPFETPYLQADPVLGSQWAKRLTSYAGLKVGLVWGGSITNHEGCSRSCTLADYDVLGDVPGVTFFSLQVGASAHQGDNPPAALAKNWVNWSSELTDFAQTAALMKQLDLVITVDTATAHLAGGLGVPVWTVLPFNVDWRWGYRVDTTPWYPTMQLFRQTHHGDWSSVMPIVVEALQKAVISAGGS